MYIRVYYAKQESRTSKLEAEETIKEIGAQIREIDHTTNKVILIGDFNAKILDNQSRNGKIINEQLIEALDMRLLNGTEKCQGKWTRVNTANRAEKSVLDYVLVSQNLWETITEMEIDEEEIHKFKGKKQRTIMQ